MHTRANWAKVQNLCRRSQRLPPLQPNSDQVTDTPAGLVTPSHWQTRSALLRLKIHDTAGYKRTGFVETLHKKNQFAVSFVQTGSSEGGLQWQIEGQQLRSTSFTCVAQHVIRVCIDPGG